MSSKAGSLEREAHEFLARGDGSEAYRLFRKAGDAYKESGAHKEAALCLASAASCWALKSGERMFGNSSLAYEGAASEAELAGDLEYASLLYRQAAINYERDMEFFGFSDCFYKSRECLRKFLVRSLLMPQKIHNIGAAGVKQKEEYGLFKRLFLCVSLTFSALVWGHGERPGRTFLSVLFVILFSAFVYMQGSLISHGIAFKPGFFQALYFSVITITTVGYGDIAPIGAVRLMAMAEALCGICVVPILIVGLSRRYLRV